jgi:hypothetical protein
VLLFLGAGPESEFSGFSLESTLASFKVPWTYVLFSTRTSAPSTSLLKVASSHGAAGVVVKQPRSRNITPIDFLLSAF